ncbi:MAG: M24 family metallopeptidase [Candidatus Heimdallarchaeaceae archaeon]
MSNYNISRKKHEERLEKVRSFAEEKKLDGIVFFKPISVYYLTGYHFIATERPICFVLPVSEEPWFYVPRLEVEHLIEKVPWIEREHYFEYPDTKHPAKIFVELLKKKGLIKNTLGLESPNFAAYWGYKGPNITDLLDIETPLFSDLIMEMRKIKDEEELKLIRESAKWGDLAHRLLQEYTEPGKNEVEVSLQASWDATKQMFEALPGFIPRNLLAAHAGYRGQIGEWSAIPHSVIQKTEFRKGQTLVTGASANVSGYLSELERTMFIGPPNDKQRKYFEIMKKAQDAVLDTFAPGIPCNEVDRAARKVFKEEGMFHLVQHHSGHAIGLEGHEPPFLDIGIDEIIKPGMVFTAEPGIYEYKFAGFRHSDTIIITEDGAERITPYPRDLEELII